MNQIISWSKGNPGAMRFLMGFMEPENNVVGITVLIKLENLEFGRVYSIIVTESTVYYLTSHHIFQYTNNIIKHWDLDQRSADFRDLGFGVFHRSHERHRRSWICRSRCATRAPPPR